MSDDLKHDGGWSDRDGVIYRQPTLTDAEREALEWARNALLVGVAVLPDDQTHNSRQHAATLGGLLERTG